MKEILKKLLGLLEMFRFFKSKSAKRQSLKNDMKDE